MWKTAQNRYVANFYSYISAKYCKVWSTFGQVIPKIKRLPFCGSQCKAYREASKSELKDTICELDNGRATYDTACNRQTCRRTDSID